MTLKLDRILKDKDIDLILLAYPQSLDKKKSIISEIISIRLLLKHFKVFKILLMARYL